MRQPSAAIFALILQLAAAERTHYAVLGVKPDADADTIRAAYRAAALTHHPDRVPPKKKAKAQAAFEEVNEAFSVLSDPATRRQYDMQRHWSGSGFAGTGGRPAVRLPTPVTLKEMGGWSAAPVNLAAVLPPQMALRLGPLPVRINLPPGSAAGDVVHLSLDGGIEVDLELREIAHPRFERRGDDLHATLWLPRWHNWRKPAVRMRSVCGQRIAVLRAGAAVSPEAEGLACVLPRYGMPLRGSAGTAEARGELHVLLRLRSAKRSVAIVAGRLGGAAAAALFVRRAATTLRDDPEAAARHAAFAQSVLRGALLGAGLALNLAAAGAPMFRPRKPGN